MLRTSVVAVLIAGGLLIIGTGAKRARSRAKVRCGIPAHDYQVAKYSPKLRAVSSRAIGIPAPVVARRSLLGANVNRFAPVLGEAFQAGTLDLQRIVSDEISNSQLRDLLSQATTRLEDVDPQQILGRGNVDNEEARRQLVQTLLELQPGNAELQSMLTSAGISNERVRGLLSRTMNTLVDDDALAVPTARAEPIAAEAAPLFSGKTFQFVESPTLRIGHCSISEVSIQVHDSGRWSLSLRADQNPVNGTGNAAGRDVTTAEPLQAFTEHLQRNQFFVRAYCYANNGGGSRLGPLGGPAVIPLDIEPFWVQKGVSIPHVVTGRSRRIGELFLQIDRAEIEFYYRTN